MAAQLVESFSTLSLDTFLTRSSYPISQLTERSSLEPGHCTPHLRWLTSPAKFNAASHDDTNRLLNSSRWHVPPLALETPSVGDTSDVEQTRGPRITLQPLPYTELQKFWAVVPALSSEEVATLNRALSLLLSAPIVDFNWGFQTYCSLLELHDNLLSQFLVSATHGLPSGANWLNTRIPVLSKTLRLTSQAILRLEVFAHPQELKPLMWFKATRVSSYAHDHPY